LRGNDVIDGRHLLVGLDESRQLLEELASLASD
jgi:hypothetical protein